MIDWRDVSLLGIDVGYSEHQATTGIAIYENGRLSYLGCVGSLASDRSRVFRGRRFDAVSVDGPILPLAADNALKRHCESMLIGSGFANRCKPGMSHHGRGLEFRNATAPFINEVCALAGSLPQNFGSRQIREAVPLVEAFPNAFLGVLLDDADYYEMGKIKRGKKSDVFFARVAAKKSFDAIFDTLDWSDVALRNKFHTMADDRSREAHDKRAALICLLTAACAYSGKAYYVGDRAGGWICLPPKALWADWASHALCNRHTKLAKRMIKRSPE